MKAGYRFNDDMIHRLALDIATKAALNTYKPHELPSRAEQFVTFYYKTYDALVTEFSSQNEQRKTGTGFG